MKKFPKWVIPIVVLASIIVALVGGWRYLSSHTFYGDDKDEMIVYGYLAALNTGLASHKMKTGDYPSTEEGLSILWVCPLGKEATWTGPYLSKVLIDPWGNSFQYRYPGVANEGGYDLFSLGPDGVVSDDDIRKRDGFQ